MQSQLAPFCLEPLFGKNRIVLHHPLLRPRGAVVMRVHQERQLNPVADEVLALTAVVRPILSGTLYALKRELVANLGGYENITLSLLSRLYRAGDGDCGICFEYAVHDAMNRGDSRVLERINDAIHLCRIGGNEPKSILFGLEKSGALQLLDTAEEILTPESRILAGTPGQPPKLRKHLDKVVGAFRNRRTRPALPYSIRGFWKADLVVGYPDADRWVGTSVKINPAHLEGAPGLRIGMCQQGKGKLIVCALTKDETS